MDWDRYAYVRNNPVIYTDPTGHFTDEELAKYFGFSSVKEMYKSSIWQNLQKSEGMIDMLHQAKLGDFIEFGKDSDNYSALMFVESEGGVLTFWDPIGKEEITTDWGLTSISNSESWALFVRDDSRYFDQYIPGKSKGESLPGPSFMNNNIGIWGGANDGKPGEIYWKQKVDSLKAIQGCAQALFGTMALPGIILSGKGWQGAAGSALALNTDLAGWGILLRNEPLLERKPVLRR